MGPNMRARYCTRYVPAMALEWRRDGYLVTDDPVRVDLDVVYGYLTACYWAKGISRETVRRSIEGSMPFSLYAGDAQVGFARVISDRATIAYLGDVFVLEAHQGRGLARWMCHLIVAHPELQGLRRWILLTRDAHGLYTQVGFTPLAKPERWMERHDPDPYSAR